jgi:16S rRNA (cytosine1402-N4)-methyltransferase
MTYRHVSVMRNEVAHYLDCRPGKIYADCTLGGSGHAGEICKKISPHGILIGMDHDKDAIDNARQVLKPYANNIHLFHRNYIHLPDALSQLNIKAVDGILLDLGLSLHQLEASGRGFSFLRDEPLDMRMDMDTITTAEEIINSMEERDLAGIFFKFGEERWARAIAKQVVRERKQRPIRSSARLAEIVSSTIPKKVSAKQRIHPATRVFMALRIAVNKELERLETFLKNVADLLNPGGRICILSFHSLEDRIVKHGIRALEKSCTCPPAFPQCVCNIKPKLRSLARKAVRPTREEIEANPMARSTKLRAAEKL